MTGRLVEAIYWRLPWRARLALDERRARRRFRCVNCRVDTINEYYMLDDQVWAATGLGPHDGMLCIACCEARLGRGLVARDFKDCEMNLIAAAASRAITLARRGAAARNRT